MKKFLLLILPSFLLFNVPALHADEGMWIPMLLEQLNEKEMQDLGMRISAKDIYDINHSSMKDGILLFGGGCTAAIISGEGLIVTNHHCGYRAIQSHSTIQNDYLTDGFWAMNHNEELANPGLTVTRLVRMEDVTDKMLQNIQPVMVESVRDSILKLNGDNIKAEAEKDTHYKAYVRPFFYGNEFYLFVTEIFKDVRLVGAPPSNIGKFGGDTDNWMWPRHTGDFSLFRIYVGKDNKPADFSENNVPYQPLYTIPISLKGAKENDFTFIFGFPGTTQEYLPSDAIEMITQVQNPARISLRRQKLDIYESFMNQDPQVRIQYSAKHSGLSNGWKKWIGESKGIQKLDGIDKKMGYEKKFQAWAASKPGTAGLLSEFDKTYNAIAPVQNELIYMNEAGFGIEIVRAARNFAGLVKILENKDAKAEDVQKELQRIRGALEDFYKDYYLPIDKKVMVTMLETWRSKIKPEALPPIFSEIDKKFDGSISEYAEMVFEKSMLSEKTRIMEFLDHFKNADIKKIRKDPAYLLTDGLMNHFSKNLLPAVAKAENSLDSLMRLYMKAQMELEPEKRFYPDANATLRIAYGKVKAFKPRDAVFYEYQTTLAGIIEKEDPNIYDYVVEDKLKELYQNKDYGKYGVDGKMPVCFIATNHTTGGNSGSPAFNADGQLIGLNFDRCWEGTMSDLMYDPDQCRNIMLDVRYFLFIVDKFAGAGHLVDEMVLVR